MTIFLNKATHFINKVTIFTMTNLLIRWRILLIRWRIFINKVTIFINEVKIVINKAWMSKPEKQSGFGSPGKNGSPETQGKNNRVLTFIGGTVLCQDFVQNFRHPKKVARKTLLPIPIKIHQSIDLVESSSKTTLLTPIEVLTPPNRQHICEISAKTLSNIVGSG